MSQAGFVADDLVRVERDDGTATVLAWGDPVRVLGQAGGRTKIQVQGVASKPWTGSVKGRLRVQPRGILNLAMVDVQQGDGLVLETPRGRILTIDGGENQLFARYCAARFNDTSAASPLPIEAMVVTHGDADHFKGLVEIRKSETHPTPRKRLFVHPDRVYHNGLVKGPSDWKPDAIFGTTVGKDGGLSVVDLEDDLRTVPRDRMNAPFRTWIDALDHWSARGPIEVRRLAYGDAAAFGFLSDERIVVEVYGPIPDRFRHGGKVRDALPLLREPPKAADVVPSEKVGPISASHTINGHSVVLRVRYGQVRFLFSGDLNREALRRLRAKVPPNELQAEILKVPHHGSADYDLGALRSIAPVVSLISSGDESARTEYIHPRATLMGALGRSSRGDPALVFCTELAAFFAVRGPSKVEATGDRFFGFERTSFGIIHVRTDGERVLVFTHSGKEQLKEAYRFTVDSRHRVRFSPVVKR